MATPIATAFVRIRPDTSGFGREVQGDLNKSGRTFAKAGEKQGGLFKSGFAKSLAVGGGLFAAGAAIKFGKDSVRAFSEAQQAQTQLQDAFKRFPKLANSNIASFRALNTQLALKTRFDDDAYASGQAILAQFRLTGDQIKQVTPLLGDYAAKTGRDVPTAAKLLGKASLGNTRALKELGINFKATGDQGKDMATVVALLQQRVGGFAEKEGKTAAGQAAILSNQFGEIQESVGAKLVPALTSLAGILLKIIGFVQRNSSVIGPLAAVLATVVVGIKAFTVAQAALNAVMALNPVGLIIVALAALAVGLVIAYKKFKPFRDIVDATFRFIKKNWPLLLGILTGPIGLATILIIKNFKKIKELFRTVWLFIANLFFDVVRGIIGGIARMVGVFAKLPGPLGKPFKAAKKAIEGAEQSVKDLQDRINRTHGKQVTVSVKMQMKNRLKIAAQQGVTLTITGKPIALATGGPIRGPGGPVGDKIPAMLSDGEYVIKAASARKLGTQFLDTLNNATSIGGDPAGMTLGFAAGGVARAQALVRAQARDPYIWGGVGPYGFDCSGLAGLPYASLKGLPLYRRYFTTASNFRALGFKPGTGAFTIGVNPFTHMAGNIGGLPFEAASTRSGIHVGSGAQSVMRFARQYYLASLGGVFGGNGSVNLGPSDLRKLMKAISIQWGVRTGINPVSFDRGGWLRPGLTLAHNGTGRAERVGGGYHITVNVPPSANQHEIGRQVVNSIKAYERGSGTGWRR